MTVLDLFVPAILAQVTLITVATLTVIWFARRHAAFRHAAGFVGLLFVISSPWLVLVLPRPAWLGTGQPLQETASAVTHQAANLPLPGREANREIAEAPDVAMDRAPWRQPVATWPQQPKPIDLPEAVGNPATVASTATPASVAPHEPQDVARPTDEVVVRPRAWRLSTVILILAGVWCLGALATAFRDWRRRRELRIITRTASDVDLDRLNRAAQDVCSALALHQLPRICVSDLSPLPFVLGVWKPSVVLPRGLWASASDARLRDILIHECAHIIRKDAWVHLLQRISAILFWFHPGVLWLNAQIARAREELCDNFVLLTGDAAEFAETLLELSESCGGKRSGLSAIGLFSTRWTLEQRVAGLLDPSRDRTTRTWRGTLAFLTVLLATLSLLVGGVGMVAEKATAESAPAIALPGKAEVGAEGPADAPRASSRKVTIRGQCVDDLGNPVAGATVRVLEDRLPTDPLSTRDRGRVAVVAEVKSDASGEFVFNDVVTPLTTPHPQHQRQLYVVASAEGRASAVASESWALNDEPDGATELSIGFGFAEAPFILSAKRQTVSGVVTDAAGRPVAGARVFMGTGFGNPFPGMWSAVTDQAGRYTIDDLERWKKTVTEELELDGSTTTITEKNSAALLNSRIRAHHPQYAIAMEAVSEVPRTVDIKLGPAAIVEGHVSDRVTGRPAVDVVVFAKGIGRDEFVMAKTDASGHYRFQLSRDHYSIWVEAEDQIAAVRKAVFAVPDKPVTDADFELIEGGFVVGTVIDDATNRPLVGSDDKPYIVAHYGPACVRVERPSWTVGEPDLSIGVQQETRVRPDGTFRLRVAPGRNAVFFIANYGETEQSHRIVTIADGEEKKVELRVKLSEPEDLADPEVGMTSKSVTPWQDAELDADMDTFLEIRRDVAIEDRQAKANAGQLPKGPSLTKVPSRERPDSAVNRLLDKFERQSIGKDNCGDPWLRTIKEIVDLGPAAVPELIEELDATQDPWMLQLLGFTLRAINDRRSIPALIRAIPKAMLPPETEKKSFTIEEWQMYRRPPKRIMLSATDPVLRTFAQSNQLEQYIQESEEEDRKNWYRFDSPAREICGAITRLTGAHNGENELLEVESYSVTSPDEIRARQQLFQRVANDWSAWWQQHQNDQVVFYSVSPAELQAIQAAVRRGAQVKRDGTEPGSPVTRVGFHRDEPVTLDDLNLLKAFPKLRELWMPLNVDPPPGGMKIIGELDSLTDLHLGTTNLVGRSIVGPGLKELRRLPQLKVLTLGNITNEDLKEIGQFKHLTKLRILGSSIDDAGMKELKGLEHLEEFDVGGYRITDAGLADLAELTSLKQLDLSHSRITDAGLTALKRLANLESLDLSSTKIKGVGIADWKNLKHLRRLTLNSTRVGDAAAKEIAEITSLTALYLTNTKITDEALTHFAQLKDLRYLEVKETEVNPAAISELKRVLPNLDISE